MTKCSKWLSFLLALTMIIGVTLIAPVTASAEDDGEYSYITLYKPNAYGDLMYDDKGQPLEMYQIMNGEAPAGISFDKATRTLTLNNFKRPDLYLAIRSEKGLLYTVKVTGSCELAGLGFMSGGAPQYLIDGTGELTLNAGKTFEQAIRLYAQDYASGTKKASVSFGKDVKLNLYGSKQVISALTSDKDNPFHALNGDQLNCVTTDNTYESRIRIEGYAADPNTKYLGYTLKKTDDPNGTYIYDEDYDFENEQWVGKVKKVVYCEELDAYLPDGSFTPIPASDDKAPAGFSFLVDEYDDNIELYTRPTEIETYAVVTTAEGKEYLVSEYIAEDIPTSYSLTCTAYPFTLLKSAAVGTNGYPYAILGEGQRVDFIGGQDTEHAPAVVSESCNSVSLDDTDLFMGFLAEPKTRTDDAVYIYNHYRDSETDDEYVGVSRWIYDKARNHYFRDYSYTLQEMTEAQFNKAYTAVTCDGEPVRMTNPENFKRVYNLDQFTDGENYYAGDLTYSGGRRFRELYSYEVLDGVFDEDGKQIYFFTPAEVQDPSKLQEVTESVKTGAYDHTVTGTELLYNKNKVSKLATPALSGASVVYGGVKVSWGKVSGARKYRVFRKEGSSGWKKLVDTTAVTYTDKKVTSGTKYTYTVRCISSDGKTFTSDYNTTGKAVTYVAAPAVSKLQNVNTGTKLTWKAVKGATYYRVFVKSGSSWKTLGDTKSTSYTATKRTGGTKYTYTVRALNASKKAVSAYNTTGWSYTFIAAPALPKLTNTKNGVQITYTKSKGGTYFRILRKQAGKSWTKIADTSAVKYVDKTAKKGVKYSYTICCVSKDGKTVYSGYNTTGRTITCKR